MRREESRAMTRRVSLLMSGSVVLLLVGLAKANSGCGPDPCSADGSCLPKRETWGWYHTHWRAWPGERPHPAPTPAGGQEGAAEEDEKGLGGFLLPDPTREDRAGSEKFEKPGAAGGAAAEEGSEEALPDSEAMPEIDPFSQRTPASGRPLQLGLPAARGVTVAHAASPLGQAYGFVQPLPAVIEGPADVAPASNAEPILGQNANAEDAPPALPASLRGSEPQAGGRIPSAAANSQRYGQKLSPVRPQQPPQGDLAPLPPVSLSLPTSIQPSQAAVRPVSWETPGGIALVNPVAAVEVEAGSEGTKQAIYYEVATDSDAE